MLSGQVGPNETGTLGSLKSPAVAASTSACLEAGGQAEMEKPCISQRTVFSSVRTVKTGEVELFRLKRKQQAGYVTSRARSFNIESAGGCKASMKYHRPASGAL